MKAILGTVISFAAVCALATQVQSAPEIDDQARIAVTGEATVKVVPNKITIRFGIETSDIDATIAKSKNTRILKKAIAAIKKAGVPESALEIDNISLQPQYDRNSRQEGITPLYSTQYVYRYFERDKKSRSSSFGRPRVWSKSSPGSRFSNHRIEKIPRASSGKRTHSSAGESGKNGAGLGSFLSVDQSTFKRVAVVCLGTIIQVGTLGVEVWEVRCRKM